MTEAQEIQQQQAEDDDRADGIAERDAVERAHECYLREEIDADELDAAIEKARNPGRSETDAATLTGMYDLDF